MGQHQPGEHVAAFHRSRLGMLRERELRLEAELQEHRDAIASLEGDLETTRGFIRAATWEARNVLSMAALGRLLGIKGPAVKARLEQERRRRG